MPYDTRTPAEADRSVHGAVRTAGPRVSRKPRLKRATPPPVTTPPEIKIDLLHMFWGQIAGACFVGSVIAFVTGASSSPLSRGVCGVLFGLGLVGVCAPYLGLRLPEPRRETQMAWRAVLGSALVLILALLLGHSIPWHWHR